MKSMINSRRLFWGLGLFAAVPACLYFFGAANYISKCSTPRKSCLEHRQVGCNISGEYNIQLGSSSSEATCDMETEGGGWTLVANYLHKKGAPGAPTQLGRGGFPIEHSTSLGSDEFKTSAWGHSSNATLVALPFQELRFRCRTSAHSRLVDFTISSEKCLNYLRTGHGACVDSPEDKTLLAKGSRSMANNEAKLPGVADKGWNEQGENALTNYPFYTDYRHHWSIGSLPGRFECDDYEPGGTTSTFHQIWAR